ADPPQNAIADRHRVFPGDGICPLPELIGDLIRRGFRGCFSLELFNPEYWRRDALDVAKEGYKKCQKVITQAARK
ncbi:MAG: sugar phosphate isomerase/epimerase, partial [Planctomycetota bacterium]